MLNIAMRVRSADHNFKQALKDVCEEVHQWVKKEFKSPFDIKSQHISGNIHQQEMRVCTQEEGLTWDFHNNYKVKTIYASVSSLLPHVQL